MANKKSAKPVAVVSPLTDEQKVLSLSHRAYEMMIKANMIEDNITTLRRDIFELSTDYNAETFTKYEGQVEEYERMLGMNGEWKNGNGE